MIVSFTICSNNYLAQAKTFTDSLIAQNKSIKVYIFLIDKKHNLIDYSFFAPAEVVEVDENVVERFSEIIEKYNIVELNTAVKPYIFEYLLKQHPECNRLYYFDPDIFVYNTIQYLDELLKDNNIILTPHFLTPLPMDGQEPFENLALNYGTFNLGFLAINPTANNTQQFLKWWGERTFNYGFSKVDHGFFVDQLWFNLVPIFFEKVYTLSHPGFNMAPWNLHERSVKQYFPDGTIILNSDNPLIFYHFSSYSFSKPEILSTKYNRYSFEKNPSIEKLHKDYAAKVLANKHSFFKEFKCQLPIKTKSVSPLKKFLYPAVQFMRSVWKRV